MKSFLKIIVPLILFILLLLPLKPPSSFLYQTPLDTRLIAQIHDPLRTYRKLMGSEIFQSWLTSADKPLLDSIIKRLANPDLATAALVSGIRTVRYLQGGAAVGNNYIPFRLVALDVAFLPSVFRLIKTLPGVTGETGTITLGNQTLLPLGNILWIGEQESIDLLQEIKSGSRASLGQKHPFSEFLVKAASHQAEASLMLFSQKPITDALSRVKAPLDLSVFIDRNAFGGAVLDLMVNEKGLKVSGAIVEKPGQNFLVTCKDTEGSFILPENINSQPQAYAGIRVAKPDIFASLISRSIFGNNQTRVSLGEIVLAGFSTNLGNESAIITLPGQSGLSVIAITVSDQMEIERYITIVKKSMKRTSRESWDPQLLSLNGLNVFYRLEKGLLILGLDNQSIDLFLESYDPEAKSAAKEMNPRWWDRMDAIDTEGCFLGYTDLTDSPQIRKHLPQIKQPIGLGASINRDSSTTRLALQVPLDNPITPFKTKVFTMARMIYLGVVIFYLLLIAGMAILFIRNTIRFIRSRKSTTAQEIE